MPGEARKPVYFLHGLLGTAYAHFGAQIQRWTGALAPVPVDLPGHGRCRVDAGPGYLDRALEYVTAVVSRFGRGRLVGASYLGGPLAVRLALARPDLVESVVLTGFAPGLDREVFLRWLAGFHTLARDNAELAAEYDRLHGARWRDTLAAYGDDVEYAYDQRVLVRAERLGAIGADVLIVNGSLKSVEREAAQRAAEFGPRVRGVVIDGAGHIASLGYDASDGVDGGVDRFAVVVEDFWSEGRGGTPSGEHRSELAAR